VVSVYQYRLFGRPELHDSEQWLVAAVAAEAISSACFTAGIIGRAFPKYDKALLVGGSL